MQGGRHCVDPLGRSFHPDDLTTQQAAAPSFCQQLDRNIIGTPIVPCLGSALDYGTYMLKAKRRVSN